MTTSCPTSRPIESVVVEEFDGSALRAFKDCHQGERCFILGNGPSLQNTDLAPLADEITFGVNGIFYMTWQCGFAPTYYVGRGQPRIRRQSRRGSNSVDAVARFFPSKYRPIIEPDLEHLLLAHRLVLLLGIVGVVRDATILARRLQGRLRRPDRDVPQHPTGRVHGVQRDLPGRRRLRLQDPRRRRDRRPDDHLSRRRSQPLPSRLLRQGKAVAPPEARQRRKGDGVRPERASRRPGRGSSTRRSVGSWRCSHVSTTTSSSADPRLAGPNESEQYLLSRALERAAQVGAKTAAVDTTAPNPTSMRSCRRRPLRCRSDCRRRRSW